MKSRFLQLILLLLCSHNIFSQQTDETLPRLLDHMLDNHYLPSALVAMGSFTYGNLQLPTPFARWFEDEVRSALSRTSRMKLFDRHVAAAMNPEIRALYGEFFGKDRADSILYGTYQIEGTRVRVMLALTDLSTGVLIAQTHYDVPRTAIPSNIEIQPSVKKIETAATLNALTSHVQEPELLLTLTTDRGQSPVYREGERMILLLTCNRDAYLKIYHIDVNGVAQLIWPNRYGGSGYIKAGEAMRFPGANDSFTYVLGRPFGTEYIKAIASTSPFVTTEADFVDLAGSASEAITRGLSVVGNAAFRAEALVVYEVVP